MGVDRLIEHVDSQMIQIRTKSLDVSFNDQLYSFAKHGKYLKQIG